VGVATVTLPGRQVQFVLIRDLSEQQRLQQQTLQMQKLDAVGRLAGGVAHDLNNILTAILGHSDRLTQQLPTSHPGHASASRIGESAQRAANLTRQLLAFSRKQALAPRVINLNAVLTQLDPMLRQLLGDDIEFRTDFSPNLDLVKADTGQLESVVVNLAVNARDAMPDGGQLILRTQNALIGRGAAVPPGQYVLLTMSDTGTGMTDDVKRHVFEPFFTTKPQGEGSGLGLATSAGIIRQSGGYIAVDSEAGKGTEFRIYLPVTSEPLAPVTTPPPSPPSSVSKKKTVLLVDDEEPIREFAGFVLSDLGYTVHTAGNGVEALSLMDQNPEKRFDLLVTDVVMPQMGGKELAQKFAERQTAARVMYISGYSADALSKQQLADATNLLAKPFTGDQLIRKVDEVLSR
jgi:nitrogen-specific signal transduction histidine kinase/CheY-like chemotaxis protein